VGLFPRGPIFRMIGCHRSQSIGTPEFEVRYFCSFADGVVYDPFAFLSGAKVKREGKVRSWGFGGLNNPCSGLKITTHTGTFAASDVHMAGMTGQLIVSKPENAKRTQLRFRVSEGKFETQNSNEPSSSCCRCSTALRNRVIA
jgi:hypothetical protein